MESSVPDFFGRHMEPMEELKYEKPKNSQYQEMVKKFPVERLICWNGN